MLTHSLYFKISDFLNINRMIFNNKNKISRIISKIQQKGRPNKMLNYTRFVSISFDLSWKERAFLKVHKREERDW